jgi:hypothetical protein
MAEDKYLFFTDDGKVHVKEGLEGLAAKFADFFQRAWFELPSVSWRDEEEAKQLIDDVLTKTLERFKENNDCSQLAAEMCLRGVNVEDLRIFEDKIIISFKLTSAALQGESFKTTTLTLEVLRR